MAIEIILGVAEKKIGIMINEIRLKNFKTFRDETIFPLGLVNILYGMNGRGKSSLIQSILLMSQTMRKMGNVNILLLNDELTSLGLLKDVRNIKAGAEPFELQLLSDKGIRCFFSDYPDKPSWAKLVDMTWGGKSIFSEKGEVDGSNSGEASSDTQSAISELQDITHVFYLSAERMGPRNHVDRKDIVASNRLGIRGEYLLNVMETEKEETILRIQSALSDILSGASISVPKVENSAIIELFLDSYDNGDKFKPVNVGFGYSFLLPVILQVMFAKEGDIVIIENPEAHLHPWAESQLMKFIVAQAKERNFQVILESHSDHIVNGLRIAIKNGILSHDAGSILHFGRIEDRDGNLNPMVEQIKIDPYGNLSAYPEDFLDEWTKEMLDLV